MGGIREDDSPEVGSLSYARKLKLVIPFLKKKYPDAISFEYDFDTGCFFLQFEDKTIVKESAYELIEAAFPRSVDRIGGEGPRKHDYKEFGSGEAGQYTGELQIRRADSSVTALLFIPVTIADKLSPIQFHELRTYVLEAYRIKVRELIG